MKLIQSPSFESYSSNNQRKKQFNSALEDKNLLEPDSPISAENRIVMSYPSICTGKEQEEQQQSVVIKDT